MSGIYIPIHNKGKVEEGTLYYVIVVDGVPKVFTCGDTFGSNSIHLEYFTDGIIVPDHGDLVDRQELLKEQLPLMDGSQRIAAVRVMDICSAKVFIPADKEGER